MRLLPWSASRLALVGRQVVEDDDIALRQRRGVRGGEELGYGAPAN